MKELTSKKYTRIINKETNKNKYRFDMHKSPKKELLDGSFA